MTLENAISNENSIGASLLNTNITSACVVLSNENNSSEQKVTACNTLVTEHNNNVLGTTYAQASYDAVNVIQKTVNPNGPRPTKPR